jgi:hypothetical protein
MEALLVLKFGSTDHPQKKVYARFQKAVYEIMFAIRNKAKVEKMKRDEFYMALYKPKQRKEKSVTQKETELEKQEK